MRKPPIICIVLLAISSQAIFSGFAQTPKHKSFDPLFKKYGFRKNGFKSHKYKKGDSTQKGMEYWGEYPLAFTYGQPYKPDSAKIKFNKRIEIRTTNYVKGHESFRPHLSLEEIIFENHNDAMALYNELSKRRRLVEQKPPTYFCIKNSTVYVIDISAEMFRNQLIEVKDAFCKELNP